MEGAAPWLWNSVVKVLLDQPVFAVLGVLGILLMMLVPAPQAADRLFAGLTRPEQTGLVTPAGVTGLRQPA